MEDECVTGEQLEANFPWKMSGGQKKTRRRSTWRPRGTVQCGLFLLGIPKYSFSFGFRAARHIFVRFVTMRSCCFIVVACLSISTCAGTKIIRTSVGCAGARKTVEEISFCFQPRNCGAERWFLRHVTKEPAENAKTGSKRARYRWPHLRRFSTEKASPQK